MKGRVENRVAIVTGGGGCIGSAVAKRLAEEGAKVVVFDITPESAQTVVHDILAAGGEAIAVVGDVTRRRDVKSLAEQVTERFGGVDILANVAGGDLGRDKPITRMSEKDWDLVQDLNLKGVFNCCQFVSDCMIGRKYGRIVNTSSMAKDGSLYFRGVSGQCSYAAAKAGVIGLTRALAVELSPYGINVNCVVPGSILTPVTEQRWKRWEGATVSPLSLTLLRHYGEPLDVANGVLFLASDEAKFITGHSLSISGGR